MKHTSIIILCTILTMATISSTSQEREKTQKGCIIKYDVTSLLGDQVSNSMGVRLGVEFPVAENRSLAADIMYIFPCNACGQSYTTIKTERTVGLMISGEYRFYLLPGKVPFSGFHVGPQLAYQYTLSEMNETYNNGISNNYQVYRSMVTAHAMTGYQLKIAGPLYFNPMLGIGFRYISSRNENKMGSDPGQYEFPYNKDFESGAKWFPSFDISIKIGLKL